MDLLNVIVPFLAFGRQEMPVDVVTQGPLDHFVLTQLTQRLVKAGWQIGYLMLPAFSHTHGVDILADWRRRF